MLNSNNPPNMEGWIRQHLVIWSAGFIDGEGCISICKVRIKDHRWLNYQMHLTVAQRRPEPLRILMSLFGGRVLAERRKGITYHKWRVSNQKALVAIKELLPYLFVKSSIARVAIEFQEQLNAWNARYGRRGYPDFVVTGREMFYLEAKALNARGVLDENAPNYEGRLTVDETVN